MLELEHVGILFGTKLWILGLTVSWQGRAEQGKLGWCFCQGHPVYTQQTDCRRLVSLKKVDFEFVFNIAGTCSRCPGRKIRDTVGISRPWSALSILSILYLSYLSATFCIHLASGTPKVGPDYRSHRAVESTESRHSSSHAAGFWEGLATWQAGGLEEWPSVNTLGQLGTMGLSENGLAHNNIYLYIYIVIIVPPSSNYIQLSYQSYPIIVYPP